jgi:uncharacterized protein YecE (DUF72 family)
MPPGMTSRPVRIGCSGWNYQSWRDVIYPRKGCPPSRWLARYAELFDTVELNATYYRLSKPAHAVRWVEQTPEDFVFAAKASRFLINVRKLRDMAVGVERFYNGIAPLVESGKLGPVLWQLPPWFQRDDETLARAAAEWFPPGRHCVEFRHPSWYHPDVYALLREFGLALAVGDHPARPYIPWEITADWTYLRFHQGRRGRRGNYSKAELVEWAGRIDGVRREIEVYAYFNNDWEAFAPRNALTLRRMLGDGGTRTT